MTAYRLVWTVICAALTLVGLGVVFLLSPTTLLLLFVAFAVAGATLTPTVAGQCWDRPPQGRTRLVLTGAVASGTGAGGVVGLAFILGPGVVPVVLLAVASSPSAVNVYRRLVVRAATRPVGSLETVTPVSPCTSRPSPEHPRDQPLSELRRLTDEQLCKRWRASYLALQLRPPSAAILETVEERQRFLDEFERRNARGLTAWLASGARAAGNPLPYLVDGRTHRHTIDWDGLTRGQDR